MADVCFVVDAFSRMIVGWQVASQMTVQTVLRALEVARLRRGAFHGGLVAHSDAGSQYTSVRYGERLAEIGAVPSVGSVGDSYDNALAESVNAFYKAELVFGPGRGAWKDVSHLEAATMSWVTWWNETRIHGYLGDRSPEEFERAYAAQDNTTSEPGIQGPESPGKPGWTREGILAAIRLGVNNARHESLNRRVRMIVNRAYVFHSAKATIALVMLTLGPIQHVLPHERTGVP